MNLAVQLGKMVEHSNQSQPKYPTQVSKQMNHPVESALFDTHDTHHLLCLGILFVKKVATKPLRNTLSPCLAEASMNKSHFQQHMRQRPDMCAYYSYH